MLRKNQVPDKTVLKKVAQRLARSGGASGKIMATIRSGVVTLTGTIQYDNQRRPAVRAAQGTEGVRSVIDNLLLGKKLAKWQKSQAGQKP